MKGKNIGAPNFVENWGIKKFVFLGPQGSGKSTQAKILAEKLGLPYIEMGQLLRDKSADNDTQAGEIRAALEIGDLVPDAIAINTFRERIKKDDCRNGFVLDGYPRNFAQLEALPKIDRVFYINVADDISIRRLIDRGRSDDSLDVISRRLDLYHRESQPLLTYFRQENILEEVDGERSIEQIHEDIFERIKNAKG